MLRILLPALLCSAAFAQDVEPEQRYLETWLQTFPTRATAVGDYRQDDRLQRLDARARADWIDFNLAISDELRSAHPRTPADPIDRALLERQVALELLEWRDEDRPHTDPLFWSEPLAQAAIYLLLRRDRPALLRLRHVAARAAQVPALVDAALQALAEPDRSRVVPERAGEAAKRLRALAGFYRNGLAQAEGADAALAAELRANGEKAADAILRLATRAQQLADDGQADFRLGERYRTRFQIYTGIGTPLPEVLAQALRDLADKRTEAAAYGRGVWSALMDGDDAVPLDDDELLRRMFRRIEAVGPRSTAELVAQYRADTEAAFAFARSHGLVPEGHRPSLVIDTVPGWLGGQGVGGVYASGPYAPQAETLFLLPNIPDDAPEEERQRFYGAFNTAFNRMIVPHELVPGHYLQLKVAAQSPPSVRNLFGDDVFVEGWGSFSERLMLDLGWGGPAERIAHYKKQIENIARLIADISVHTEGWEKDRLAAFLKDEALLDAHFAGNLWMRAQLSSPQLTTYHLGYREIHAHWRDWLKRHPETPPGDFVRERLEGGALPVHLLRTGSVP